LGARASSSSPPPFSPRAQALVDLEAKFGSTNYAPLPVMLERGSGVHVYDVDGVEYFDFLSGYSAVNQGHAHPRLVAAMRAQAGRLTLVSRAFHSSNFGPYAEFLCSTLGYDRVLPMNTGVETGETALKLARRWAHDVKGVPANASLMLYPAGNFWGRTLAAISSSDDPDSTGGFGPLLPGYAKVPYNDVPALEAFLDAHGARTAGFMVEPVQGEAGVVVPDDGYLAAAARLCRKHRVLLIADEVQTGLGRTGRLLGVDHDGVKPDILLLGKALSGGMMPVSAVLASSEVILTIKPGQHGSTFGGNPLACAVAREALAVVLEERLPENAAARGEEARAALRALAAALPGVVEGARGRGLLNALIMRPGAVDARGQPLTAWDVCLALKDAAGARHGARRGLLAKPTHGHIIRFAPPLVITAEQHAEALATITLVVTEMAAGNREPHVAHH